MSNGIGYKLVTPALTAHGGFQYTIGEAVTTTGVGNLCGPGWLHYYRHPLLAVLLDPIHADFGPKARMFKVRVAGGRLSDRGLQEGCTKLTLLEEIPLPVFTTAQRVKFARLCADWAKKAVAGPRLNADNIAEKLAELAETAHAS